MYPNNRALLECRIEGSWRQWQKDPNDEVIVLKYQDTLLQLAWRMQDYEMFRVVEKALNEIDPGLVKAQLESFKGEQSDALEELIAAYQAHDKNSTYDSWQKGVGGAQLRCWETMAWVLHRMHHDESGWNNRDIDKEFSRDTPGVRALMKSEFNSGSLGHRWALTRGPFGLFGRSPMLRVRGDGVRAVCATLRLNGCSDHRVVTDLRSKCLRKRQAIQEALSIELPHTSSNTASSGQ